MAGGKEKVKYPAWLVLVDSGCVTKVVPLYAGKVFRHPQVHRKCAYENTEEVHITAPDELGAYKEATKWLEKRNNDKRL